MRSKPPTVGIAQGHGLVARFGGVVVYLAGDTASSDRILGTVEAVAEAEHPGEALAQRLAAVVFGGTSEVPPFGVVAPTGDGTLILLRGPVFAEINGAEGTRRLDGARAFTWVDEIVREPLRRITVGTDTGTTLKALPRTDLRAGVVPGGGFVLNVALRRAGKKGAATPRPSATASTSGSTSTSTSEPKATTSTSELAPTAAAGFAATPEPTGAADAIDPATGPGKSDTPAASDTPTSAASATSSTARASSAQSSSTPAPSATRSAAAGSSTRLHPSESARPRARPRPPIGNRPAADRQLAWSQTHQPGARPEPVALHKTSADRAARFIRPAAEHDQAAGTLVLENGTAYPLDRPYVIGRGPQTDDAVRTASAAPIVIQRDRHVSRVHAYVSVDRGKVFVRDATATSGTYIAPPGTDQWTRIGTSPTELLPGWSVRISERVLTYRCQTEDHRDT
ncbi:FHA domain-containing protein [Nocardia sp. NPDC051052]|uniref:FHA domain-containing protein n=1 Tax=Nocardia sp. NPDC051052 TaxID=3364322 RepID=UPI00378C697A